MRWLWCSCRDKGAKRTDIIVAGYDNTCKMHTILFSGDLGATVNTAAKNKELI